MYHSNIETTTTPTQAMSSSLKLRAAQAVQQKMLSCSHFSICTMDCLIEMMVLKPDREAYKTPHKLHRVDYNQMPSEFVDELPTVIHRVLASPSFRASRLNIVNQAGSLALVRH